MIFDFKKYASPSLFWILVTSTMLCSGCSPLLNSSTQRAMPQVYIARINERSGQKLRHLLQGMMKPRKSEALYNLRIDLIEQNKSLVLDHRGQSSVEHYSLKANYVLSRIYDQYPLSKGSLRVYGVKPLSVSYYSQSVMDQASQDRALEALAYKLWTAVALVLKNLPAPGGGSGK